LAAGRGAAGEGTRQELAYAPAPVDNPLKGLVPYVGDKRELFPHSMEFNYIPFSALVTGYDQYDWKALEQLLDAAAGRGHQAVFRVHLEFPNQKNVIPAFLLKDGLKVITYTKKNPEPFPPTEMEVPNYADDHLRKAMKQFIAALGKKYDGDPRIGFITAGLLGTWGEWHDAPRNDLFAGKDVQTEVMETYEASFKKTRVLLRYPAAEGNKMWAANVKRPFGYHDDSFAWWTLDTGKASESWYFIPSLKAAGPAAMAKWKTMPIGGEIRPEAWGVVFDASSNVKQLQDFRKCVEATHVSWLMDSGMFKKVPVKNEERIKRALEAVGRMGYEFHVVAVTVEPIVNEMLAVKVEIENMGVAPFYYDWPVELGLLDAEGKEVKVFKAGGKLVGILPGEKPRVWDEKLDVHGVQAGSYTLALRVANPLPKGMPVRFANVTQDRLAKGWLSLTVVAGK